ncbi:MAG: sulfotransferase [Parvibaculaceae bacterium]
MQSIGRPTGPAAQRRSPAAELLAAAARFRDARDPAHAIQLCQQAQALEPQNPEVPFTAATVYDSIGDLKNALKAYRSVLRLKPGFLPALVNCAGCLADLGDLPESLDLYTTALKSDPNNLVVRQNAAQILMRLKRPGDAAIHLRALARSRGGPLDHIDLAEALEQAGDHENALQALETALKKGAPAAPTHVLMARVDLVRGRLEEARTRLGQALALDPHDGHAHYALASNFPKAGPVEDRIAAIRAALEASEGKPADSSRVPLHFALARLHDRAGQADEAFRNFELATRHFADNQIEDDARLEERAAAVKRVFTSDWLAEHRKWGNPDERPTFVFGLPRSGTTLVEQILASHAQVSGLGEFEMTGWTATYLTTPDPERVKRAAQAYLAAYPTSVRKSRRVIDKSVGSYLEVGLLTLLFPNARFINCVRHPLDVGFSCWSHNFAANAIVYSYRFDRLARHMHLYVDMMRHWHGVMPGRILDVSYEELLAAPEEISRQAVAQLGLEWDPACLEFQKTERDVRTASVAEVRQSLYTSSKGRWKAYERHLTPLSSQVGDLVSAYETAGTYGWERAAS